MMAMMMMLMLMMVKILCDGGDVDENFYDALSQVTKHIHIGHMPPLALRVLYDTEIFC